MSKNRKHQNEQGSTAPAAENITETLPNITQSEGSVAPASERREVEKFRQCPVCYTGDLNGVGVAASTRGSKRYYKCDRCGHNWSATITPARVESIAHRDVDLETRQE